MSNDLYHWGFKKDHKYVKREWKNGRWQYWYNNSNLKRNLETKIGIQQKKVFERSIDNYKRASKAADAAMDKFNEGHDRNRKIAEWHGSKSNKYAVEHEKLWYDTAESTSEQLNRAVKAGEQYVNAKESYLKTPLGKLHYTIDKTKANVRKKLGYAHKDALNSAETKLVIAEANYKKAQRDNAKAAEKLQKNETSKNADTWRRTLEYDAHKAYVNELDAWLDADNAKEDYERILNAYLNTPVGKLESRKQRRKKRGD